MSKKPRILMIHRQNSAVAYYRTWVPARYLKSKGYDVTWWEYSPYWKRMKPTPKDFLEKKVKEKAYDLILMDRSLEHEELGLFSAVRHHIPGCRMVVDFDDDFEQVPWWNPTHNKYQNGQPYNQIGKMHLKLAELTSVSTPTLAERFKDRTHDIMCAENMIDPKDWVDLPENPERKNDPCLRILYGGANGHFGDLDAVRDGLEAVIRNPPVPLRVVCFGAIPRWLHEVAREFKGRVLSLPWVPFMDYPQAVAWGGFDVALAPLADHPFNEAKSNIKWLEAGLQRIPLVCSKIGPYKDIPNDCAIKVENTAAQWAQGLHTILKDKGLRETIVSTTFKEVMSEWTLDKKGKVWENIIERALSRPRIVTLEDTRLESEPKPVAVTAP